MAPAPSSLRSGYFFVTLAATAVTPAALRHGDGHAEGSETLQRSAFAARAATLAALADLAAPAGHGPGHSEGSESGQGSLATTRFAGRFDLRPAASPDVFMTHTIVAVSTASMRIRFM